MSKRNPDTLSEGREINSAIQRGVDILIGTASSSVSEILEQRNPDGLALLAILEFLTRGYQYDEANTDNPRNEIVEWLTGSTIPDSTTRAAIYKVFINNLASMSRSGYVLLPESYLHEIQTKIGEMESMNDSLPDTFQRLDSILGDDKRTSTFQGGDTTWHIPYIVSGVDKRFIETHVHPKASSSLQWINVSEIMQTYIDQYEEQMKQQETLRRISQFMSPVLSVIMKGPWGTGDAEKDGRLENIRDRIIASLDDADLSAVMSLLTGFHGDFGEMDLYMYPVSEHRAHPNHYQILEVAGDRYVLVSVDDFDADTTKPKNMQAIRVSSWAIDFQRWYQSSQSRSLQIP